MMRKMSFVVALLALLSVCALIMGCQSCFRASNAANDLRKCKGVPAVIADARLLSYRYTLQGTMRWPLHSESVEVCKDDSSRCVVRILDLTCKEPENFDSNGDPLPDSVVVSSEVLDSVKQMIIAARAWRFKKDYSPRVQVKDGCSWDFLACFAVTDSVLAATPEDQRARLLRRGGCRLSSGGCNASPDTELFEQVRLYLKGVYEAEKNAGDALGR